MSSQHGANKFTQGSISVFICHPVAQEHTPVIRLAFGAIALSNESGISDQWLPTELRRKAVDGKLLL